jgi:hypothetical protein
MPLSTIKDDELVLKIRTISRTVRVPMPLDNQVLGICRQDGKTYTDALIYLLQNRLADRANKVGKFFCQCCGLEETTKKQHTVPIGFEKFFFCDDCFFSDKYKEFIKRML